VTEPAEDTLALTAYRTDLTDGPAPEPADRRRAWMDASYHRFAYRCLPMPMANQAGWWVRNDADFVVRWDGGQDRSALTIRPTDGGRPATAAGHFGQGILTFPFRLLFRAPPGWNLLVRGPADLPKDGAPALEGLVETDWAVSTFTMNWQITRPDTDVEFRAGEPICMARMTGQAGPCVAECRRATIALTRARNGRTMVPRAARRRSARTSDSRR
jgi:hypothetical protein